MLVRERVRVLARVRERVLVRVLALVLARVGCLVCSFKTCLTSHKYPVSSEGSMIPSPRLDFLKGKLNKN